MLKKRIITTMLWNGTTLVKGQNFDNSRRAGSPMTTIQIYNSRDVDEIIFFDIVKNKENYKLDLDFFSQISNACNVPITIGGGITEIYEITDLLMAGADKVAINSEVYNNIKPACKALCANGDINWVSISRLELVNRIDEK